MGASTGLGIRRRIVHVHNADELLPTPSRLKDRLLREPLRRLGLRADRVVGISDHTLETYLDGRPRRPGRDIVHYYGVDPAPFRQERSAHDRGRFRAALGLPPDALILLFGGRLTPEKNPLFTVDVLAELRRQEPRTVGVFAGAGSLEGAVLERAAELQVTDAVRMLGWRNDLHEIMMASDWFILPRPERPLEGFRLAVVEAQLAGLRMLLSPGVPDDPLLPSAVFGRIPLAAGPKAWADAASDMLRGREPSAAAALADLSASAMQLDTALAGLAALHG